MIKPVLKIKKLEHFIGDTPKYQTSGASGLDVAAAIKEKVVLQPGERGLIPTGMVMEIPQGFEIQVRPRSGLALKNGVGVLNSPGTIDCDYRGEVKIIIINLGNEPLVVCPGDRIAQLVIQEVIQAQIQEVSELTETSRGMGGFGSTGVATV